MLITDTVTLGDVRVNDAGYLETFAHTARTGVQQYLGIEAGRPDLAMVNVYRDEREVFSRRSLDTFSKIPITIDHPPTGVNSENWRKFAVGTTGEEVLRDGERLKIGLKITDKAAVEAVRAGKRELSVGYSTELVWEDGVAPDGTPFQARQTNIIADHIAIVSAGRAGPQCRIGDSWATVSEPKKEPTMADLTTVVVGDSAVQIAASDATKLEAFKASMKQSLADAETKHADDLKAKDADLAKKDAEIDALKGKILSDADLDKRVKARADLIATAGKIAKDVKTAGLSDAAIRKAVVTAKLGDAALSGKSEAYIDARFDILAEEASKVVDGFKAVIEGGVRPTNPVTDSASAYQAMLDRDRSAWQTAGKQEA
ncbi:DUF2213 domain-containing protein [Jiella avicenniae]|uniref:DUF2213 domain-containing protein n=1 Tax=Jiella avicenniae TaxID=2907202 RepID=A0A9X1T4E2_9HYPH|nr:DUF2213 domain-containing protein [Jiella avicenniae]MCE7028466.1 DUF2213 domain-containing protein [Jiella avicenniae]